jgi:hypothetical protein
MTSHANSQALATSPCEDAGPCTDGKFTLLSPARLAKECDWSWVVKGIFPKRGVGAITGRSKSGKSNVAIGLAASIAEGLPWFGKKTTKTNVVYIALEGQGGIGKRTVGWSQYHGRPYPQNVTFMIDSFGITSDDTVALGNLIKRCAGAGVIIIDTLNKAAPGIDENSSADMGRVIAGAYKLHTITNSLVILIHHLGKDASRGPRGHSSLEAALDAIVLVERDGSNRRWSLDKAKDEADGTGHAFDLEVVEIGIDEDGDAVKTCVVVPVDGFDQGADVTMRLHKNQAIVLEQAKSLLVQRRLDCEVNSELDNGIEFNQLVDLVKPALIHCGSKHAGQRTREALSKLISLGMFINDKGVICLSGS